MVEANSDHELINEGTQTKTDHCYKEQAKPSPLNR